MAGLELPHFRWRFLARKIIDQWSIFQQTMFDYRRVPQQLGFRGGRAQVVFSSESSMASKGL